MERDEQLTALFSNLDDGLKDASVLLVNPDCNRNDYYGWTVNNQGTNSGQAWDGDNNNTYWDKWNSGSLSSSMEQTIGYLPNGEYEVSALLRCTTGQTITFSANHNGKTYTKTLTGIGDQSSSGSEYQRGWQKVTLPAFTALSGDQLIISASIDAQATTWWSLDHFTLTWKPSSITVGITNNESQVPTDDIIYDLQGRRLKEPATNGIYIRNGKKYVR